VRRTILLLLLLAGAGCVPHVERSADSPPVHEWPLFKAPDGRFSIRMPGQPLVKEVPGGTTYYVNVTKYDLYQAGIARLPMPTRDLSREQVLKVLDETKESTFMQYVRAGSAHLLSSQLGDTQGKPSLTYLLEFLPPAVPHSMMLSRMILDPANGDLIMISHSILAEQFQRETSAAYIDSFELHPQ
jgi:hypothetical protein